MKLQTEHLTLRTVTQDDLHEVARMWNFEKGEISLEEAEKAIIRMQKNHEQNRPNNIVHLCLAVYENNCDKIIGWCGLDGRHATNEHLHTANIFYLIDKDYRRRGYASECAKQLLEYGFAIMEMDRIDGACAKDNIGSQKILEKIGMKPYNKEKTEDSQDSSLHYFTTIKDYAEINS